MNRSHPEAVNELHEIDATLNIPLGAHRMFHPSEHTDPGVALSLLGHFFVALQKLAQYQRRGDRLAALCAKQEREKRTLIKRPGS